MKRKPIREIRARNHKALFDSTLPFQPKVEVSKVKYNRKAKHKKNNE